MRIMGSFLNELNVLFYYAQLSLLAFSTFWCQKVAKNSAALLTDLTSAR